MNGMISCKSCMAHNSLDSTFCKKCGATLPADDIQQAKQKLEAVVADGFKIFNAGRTDEAMQIAETAVAANPLSTAALSLKAMCHERMGQIAEALECHEKVLDIDPDSMIDKIKVNDLRNLLVSRTSAAAVPDRRLPILSAVAAFVLFASIGLVIAKSNSKADDKVAANIPANQAQGSHFDPQTPSGPPGSQTQTQPQANTQANVGNSGQSNGGAPAAGDNSQPSHSSDTRDSTVKLPPSTGPVLPNPNDHEIPPLKVELDENTKNALHNAATNSSKPKDPDPEPTANTGNQTTQDPPKREAPGIMEIQVVSRNGKPVGDGNNSDPKSHPNGVEALLRAARSQYQLGNYSQAANSYERALRAGADPTSANQRLAQCYEKLGRSSEAVAAYNRAIDALQADINSGRGDKDRLSAALESCKQAVKVLGG